MPASRIASPPTRTTPVKVSSPTFSDPSGSRRGATGSARAMVCSGSGANVIEELRVALHSSFEHPPKRVHVRRIAHEVLYLPCTLLGVVSVEIDVTSLDGHGASRDSTVVRERRDPLGP